jgi:hypothetical protein
VRGAREDNLVDFVLGGNFAGLRIAGYVSG